MRKWLAILLCLLLTGCQLDGTINQSPENTEQVETTNARVELSDTLLDAFHQNRFDDLLLNRSSLLFPIKYDAGRYGPRYISIYHTKDSEIDSPQINIVYDRENENHEFIVSNFKFSYLTGGNVRTVKTDFHIIPTQFIESFSYDMFEIDIVTQDNITLKVSYDMNNKEFYDASESALENDVMNFNAAMKESLLYYCNRVIDTLRNDFAVMEAFDKEYTKYIASDMYEIVKPSELNIPYYYTPYEIKTIETRLVNDLQGVFTINYKTPETLSLWRLGYILYHLDQPFNSPSEIYKTDEFIPFVLVTSDSYSCVGRNCYLENGSLIEIPYIRDGYFTIYSLNDYTKAVRNVFRIESTYSFTTGTNEEGFYEDANKGILVAYGPDGDGPVIPCGIYNTKKEEINDILKLSYKKYDLNEYISWDEVKNYTVDDYEREFTNIIMSNPTWIATLKYNSETDSYQIMSLEKE